MDKGEKKIHHKEAVLEEETNGEKDNQKNSSSELYFLMCCKHSVSCQDGVSSTVASLFGREMLASV